MKARELWGWFADHAEQVAASVRASGGTCKLEGVLRELDHRIKSLDSDIGWEIGPHDGGWVLALSPGGTREGLARTTALVAEAPDLNGWHFLAAKPPKAWDRQFDYSGYRIDARAWRYRLRRWDDGALGVIWGVDDDVVVDDTTFEELGWFVLESELGEEVVIRNFVDVEMTRLAAWDSPELGNAITVMRDHVESMLGAGSRGGAG
jgi:hypothetical protein